MKKLCCQRELLSEAWLVREEPLRLALGIGFSEVQSTCSSAPPSVSWTVTRWGLRVQKARGQQLTPPPAVRKGAEGCWAEHGGCFWPPATAPEKAFFRKERLLGGGGLADATDQLSGFPGNVFCLCRMLSEDAAEEILPNGAVGAIPCGGCLCPLQQGSLSAA